VGLAAWPPEPPAADPLAHALGRAAPCTPHCLLQQAANGRLNCENTADPPSPRSALCPPACPRAATASPTCRPPAGGLASVLMSLLALATLQIFWMTHKSRRFMHDRRMLLGTIQVGIWAAPFAAARRRRRRRRRRRISVPPLHHTPSGIRAAPRPAHAGGRPPTRLPPPPDGWRPATCSWGHLPAASAAPLARSASSRWTRARTSCGAWRRPWR
jgi:hypothetical protein